MSEMELHFRGLKYHLNVSTYRRVVAEAMTRYYLEKMNDKGEEINRKKLLERVNLSLYSMNIEEVSYGFIRQFC
ncbi:hypothetical protein ACQCVB_11025 [Fictibacillus phosphorivorans]|uniref:hypothetical protein n=1 Tax=Fictibacillus phosphorivorans TaxID=1221500 RepID=UPI003CEAB5DF